MDNSKRPPLTGVSYKIIPLDTCHTSDTQKTITIELYEGNWPYDEVIKEMFREEGYCMTVSTVQSNIKQVTMVRSNDPYI